MEQRVSSEFWSCKEVYKKDLQYQFQTFYFSDNTERKIYFEDTICLSYCSSLCV
jgi:hypothetical protein